MVGQMAELAFHIPSGDGFPVAAPPVAEQRVHLGSDLDDLERAAGCDERDGSFGDSGELVGPEPEPETAYRLDLVCRALGRAQHPALQADQPDMAQQVVQDRQGEQVLLDRSREGQFGRSLLHQRGG
jgi:hypothetical protein